MNDYRAIRLARDKAVAAVRARAAGIPFPKTWFAHRSTLLEQIPAAAYPLVAKPDNGRAMRDVLRVTNPPQLARLDIDDSGALLAQPYLPNPGYDVKLYNTGDEVFAAVKHSPLHPGPMSSRPPPAGSSRTSTTTTSPASATSRSPPGGWPARCCA